MSYPVNKPEKMTRLISPHHRVSLQNSNLFLKLAQESKIETLRDMRKVRKVSCFNQIKVDFWCKMPGKLMLTSGG